MILDLPIVGTSTSLDHRQMLDAINSIIAKLPRQNAYSYLSSDDDLPIDVFRFPLPPLFGWIPTRPTHDDIEVRCEAKDVLAVDTGRIWWRLQELFAVSSIAYFSTEHRLTRCTPYPGRLHDWSLVVRREGRQWSFLSRREMVLERSPDDLELLEVHKRILQPLGVWEKLTLVSNGSHQQFKSTDPLVIPGRSEHPNSVPPSVDLLCDSAAQAYAAHERVRSELGLDMSRLRIHIVLSRDRYNSHRAILTKAMPGWTIGCVGRFDPQFTLNNPPEHWPQGEPVWRPVAMWLAKRASATSDETYITCAQVKFEWGECLEFSGNCKTFSKLTKYVRRICDLELRQTYPPTAVA